MNHEVKVMLTFVFMCVLLKWTYWFASRYKVVNVRGKIESSKLMYASGSESKYCVELVI